MKKTFYLLLVVLLSISFVFAQEKEKEKKKDQHEFTKVVELKAMPVISQGGTGTCWSFATTSFIESELIRMGKGEIDLSEMFSVRYKYPEKALNFIRYRGSANFGQGGQAHDVIDVIKEYGFIPNKYYNGLVLGSEKHDHGELANLLTAMVNTLAKSKSGQLTKVWNTAYEKVLETYLGVVPQEFEFNGKKYTPKSFVTAMGFNPDDYVELTSYSHHPFYTKFNLEMNDNFTNSLYYNLPLDEFMATIENALNTGYTVAFDGDVSDKYFNNKKCYAVVPENDKEAEAAEKENRPEKEKVVTQGMRQDAFNNFSATDDHLMHLTGIVKNQNGTKFYTTKNSWGTEEKDGVERKYKGFWYMSEQYIRLNGLAVMVHKNAIPKELRTKLGI